LQGEKRGGRIKHEPGTGVIIVAWETGGGGRSKTSEKWFKKEKVKRGPIRCEEGKYSEKKQLRKSKLRGELQKKRKKLKLLTKTE